MRHGNLLIISGPSGAGKGTLVSKVKPLISDIWVSVSATTRSPREGEIEGVHYYFKTEEEFDDLIENDGFIEWACVHGNKYGTLRAAVEDHIAAGKQVILEIDVQGAFQVREKMPDAKLIFIAPVSMEVLEARLRGRNTETEEAIQKRINGAKLELSQKMEYDVEIVNDDLEKAVNELYQVIESYAEN